MHITGKLRIFAFVLVTVLLLAFTHTTQAETEKKLSSGETVYVSIYSNVFSGPKKVPLELASMLSIRNTDTKYSITIFAVDYYDSHGKKIESYIKNPVTLNPLASNYYYIKEYDTRGGAGANFIVKWNWHIFWGFIVLILIIDVFRVGFFS